ncbi:hypothetical protein Back11_63150 [Paenibacillus baekrokdamisoli]|uniref:Uncharacterized protein n=1 Tax=Paenibacillus baekrokdamisoli TaxID=1712516 RepID=A0A3G9J1B6_9BACL|nr:hypothetical protein Back11_63150 [Paenibacillus baekrokdamisoli]
MLLLLFHYSFYHSTRFREGATYSIKDKIVPIVRYSLLCYDMSNQIVEREEAPLQAISMAGEVLFFVAWPHLSRSYIW